MKGLFIKLRVDCQSADLLCPHCNEIFSCMQSELYFRRSNFKTGELCVLIAQKSCGFGIVLWELIPAAGWCR